MEFPLQHLCFLLNLSFIDWVLFSLKVHYKSIRCILQQKENIICVEHSLGELYVLLNLWKVAEWHTWSKRNLAFHWCWLVIMVYHLQGKFIADLGMWTSLTCGECLLQPALLCSTHSKHWPGKWYVENVWKKRNCLLQNSSGWNLDLVKGMGVLGWA